LSIKTALYFSGPYSRIGPAKLTNHSARTERYNVVKYNLTELTTKSACVPVVVSGVLICVCTRIPCAPGLRRIGSLHSDSVYSEHCFAWEYVFKRSLSLSLPSPFLLGTFSNDFSRRRRRLRTIKTWMESAFFPPK